MFTNNFFDAAQISLKMTITEILFDYVFSLYVSESFLFISLCNWNILNGHIFVDSPSIRCRNSTWKLRGNYINFERESTSKLWHRFDVDISTWIRLSKSTKYRWVLYVDFSMSFQRQIDVTSVLAVSILSFSALGTYSKLFWNNAESL